MAECGVICIVIIARCAIRRSIDYFFGLVNVHIVYKSLLHNIVYKVPHHIIAIPQFFVSYFSISNTNILYLIVIYYIFGVFSSALTS